MQPTHPLPVTSFSSEINPEGFDDPVTLAGFIDAMRWGAVTSADPNRYQAPFWSGVTVEAYQLEPLRRALASPRANLLLADDVGLGKTIEAGLVMQELFLRHRARTAVIVCPPSLALKWQDEMRDKFGLQFVIVNSELMAEVRRSHGLHANPFLLYPRVIVSMAWLPQVRAQRLLRDVYAQASEPQARQAIRLRRPDRGRGPPCRAGEPVGGGQRAGLRGGHPAHGGGAPTRRQVRAPPVLERDPAQRLPRVVHRADGDDRPAPVLPRRDAGLHRAQGRDGPPAQDATLTGKGFKDRKVKILELHPGGQRAGDVLPAR